MNVTESLFGIVKIVYVPASNLLPSILIGLKSLNSVDSFAPVLHTFPLGTISSKDLPFNCGLLYVITAVFVEADIPEG